MGCGARQSDRVNEWLCFEQHRVQGGRLVKEAFIVTVHAAIAAH